MLERRKIAAILAADVVGFSRMTSADEDRTLARLRALRVDLIDPLIASQNGRVFKRTGDGALVEFRSVVEAVRCGISMQSAMAERNAGTPEDQRIVFRIGIHLGDVVEESDGDLMGDGVNIAARLEGVATPGAICLSQQAYWQVKGRLDIAVSDLGPISLKNIAEPVRAFSLQVGAPAPAKRVALPAPGVGKKRVAGIVGAAASIVVGGWVFVVARAPTPAKAAHLSMVVLPFANLTPDPDQDYFADGVTDNLITDLSRIRNSFVIARNTAFTFKGKNVDVKAIGRDLGVRYVLEGSVQRDQNRVRVSAQLIDAETGASRWADRFEEEVGGLFKLQDQVVSRLSNALGYAVEKAEAEKGAGSQNPDAIDLVMRAKTLNYKLPLSKDENEQARALYEKALTLDAKDLDAIYGVALSYQFDMAHGWGAPGVDHPAKIIDACDRIIAIDPSYSGAYDLKGWGLLFSGHPDDALRSADAGLAINPINPDFHVLRGVASLFLGRFEQAKQFVQQAIPLSPRDPQLGFWHVIVGDAELGLGRYDAAIEQYKTAIDGGYKMDIPYKSLAAAYALAGNLDEAKSALAQARRLNPNLTIKWLTPRTPSIPAMFEGLRKAGLPEE